MNEFKDLKENLIKSNVNQNKITDYHKTSNFNGIVSCDVCNDLEWIINSEDKAIRCHCSSDKNTDLEKKSLAWTNGSIFTQKFSNFIQDTPINKKNFKIVKKFCENIGKPGKPTHIFLFGNVGTGKSHLIKSCVNFFIQNSLSGKYFLYPEFKLAIQNFDENVQLQIKKFMEYPILIFDEMYMGYERSGYGSETFNDILHTRWERKRPTLVTGNIKPNQLSDPIRSRFFDDSMTIRIDTWNSVDKRPGQKAF